MLFLSCVCYAVMHICLLLWSPAGIGLLLFHWYPGSGVVLGCIDS